MKKTSLFILAVILLFTGCSSPSPLPDNIVTPSETSKTDTRVFKNGEWTLTESLYEDNAYNAVNYFVSLSGAVADGVYDDSLAIQAALDKAGNAGGGNVYIPKGKYRVSKPITIPDNVTLIGDFVSPTSKKGAAEGTVIIVENSELLKSSSLFILNDNSAISDLTVWYEAQSFDSVLTYPYTVCHSSGRSASVKNFAVLNAYNGITVDSSECETFSVENVYMTAINNALRVVTCKKKLTVNGLSVSPVYWINDDMTPRSDDIDYSDLNDIIYSDLTAVYLLGVADASLTDISIDTAHIGFHLNISASEDKAQLFSLLNTSNTLIPVYAENISTAGAAFSLCTFGTSNLLNSTAVSIGKNFTSTLSFNSCIFPGQPSVSVKSEGTGRLSFVNCKFVGWRDVAIDSSDIIFTAVNSAFNAGSQPVSLGEKSVGMLAMCSLSLTPQTDDSFLYVVSTENEYEFAALDSQTVGSSSSGPNIAKNIFYASDHGLSESAADNSAAIQSAVNYAYLNGGGTVFVPAGQYKLNSPIVLKKGVSLRGVGSGTDPITSTVFITDKNAGDDFKLITLENSSSLCGVTLYYYDLPDFVSAETELSGIAVYSENSNDIGIFDVCFVSPSFGIVLNECNSACIENISGTAIKNGIRLESCTDIFCENIDFLSEFATSDALIAYQQSNFFGIYALDGENIVVRDMSCENADYAVYLDAEDVPVVPEYSCFTVLNLFSRDVYATVAVNKYPFASFVNVVSRPTVFSTNAYHITTFYGNRGTLNIYNLLGSGNVTGGVYARSGTVSVQSSVFNSLGKSAVRADGANVSVIGSMFLDNDCTYHVEADSGGVFLLGNITNNTSTAFGGIETKYIRRYIGDSASYADDGNIRGVMPE